MAGQGENTGDDQHDDGHQRSKKPENRQDDREQAPAAGDRPDLSRPRRAGGFGGLDPPDLHAFGSVFRHCG